MAKLGDRIVVLIDMDCFFCQVEARLDPSLKGKPIAVVQYSSFGAGSIIAVNYEARDYGVTRHMKGNEAKEKCPDIILVKVPPLRNKPDTSRYRTAGREVIDVLKKYCAVIERASVDEAYLDITDLVDQRLESMSDSSQKLVDQLEHTFVVGYCDDESNDEEKRKEGIEKWVEEAFDELGDIQARKLAIAGLIVEEFRSEIYAQCEFRCSAGISYNKILAKLACGLHKPDRQTILPTAAVPGLYSKLPVKKVRNLGGKFGNIVMESLNCNVMADLLRFSLQDLQRKFDEKTGLWLFNIARGIDNELVTNRLICKSIGASKNFPGKQAITKLDVLKQWVNELAAELVDRLEQDMEENQRRAVNLTVSYHYYHDKKIISQSRSCPLTSYKVERITNLCVDLITKATQKPICFVGMGTGKFVPMKESGNFINFFKAGPSKQQNDSEPFSIQTIKPEPLPPIKSAVGKSNKSDDFNDSEESSDDDSLDLSSKYESKIKTYTRKESQLENTDKKPINSELIRSLNKTTEVSESKFIDLQLDRKPSSLLLNTDFEKALNGENFKTSFFMNFFKDSSAQKNEQTKEPLRKLNPHLFEDSNSSDQHANESPDLFDDCSPDSPVASEDSDLVDDEPEVEKKSDSNRESNALVQLKEIFPDLNNIDAEVVKLLPLELQREAEAYLKSHVVSSSAPSAKNNKKNPEKGKSKLKSTKVQSKSKPNSIQSFFLQNKDPTNDSNVKRCEECGFMIPVEKYVEHCDFHMAQSLQRLINQSNNEEHVSRSIATEVTGDPELASMKRKSDVESPKSSKKSRSIESFLHT